MPPFHLVNVSWGQAYTDLYLNVSLPTQLAPGNLPAVADCPGTVYKIYTTAADAERIRQAPIYLELCRVIPTEIIEIEVDAELDRYLMMSKCHRMALADASKVQAALVYLMPDMLLADGAFVRIRQLAEEGKKVVFTTGLRLAKETYLSHFMQRFRPHGELCVQVSPRELVQESLGHLHPFLQASYWPPKVTWPSTTYWAVEGEGAISRSFHLHTLMVVVPEKWVTFTTTFDDDYVERAYPDGRDLYVVQDSDEITIFEVSSKSHLQNCIRETPLTTLALAKWGQQYCTANHLWLFEHSIRIHAKECSSSWAQVEAEVEQDAEKILRLARSRIFAIGVFIYNVAVLIARYSVRLWDVGLERTVHYVRLGKHYARIPFRIVLNAVRYVCRVPHVALWKLKIIDPPQARRHSLDVDTSKAA